jgi:biotin operon repressor
MSTSLSKMAETTEDGGWNEVDTEDLARISDKLDRASQLLAQLAENGRQGQIPSASALSTAITFVLGARGQIYGDRRPDLEGSARLRILTYFQQNEGEAVSADVLAEVSGIRAWERRVRELREQGYDVAYLGNGRYRLSSEP